MSRLVEFEKLEETIIHNSMKMNEVLEKLSDGDLRSEGKADEVAKDIIANPKQLELLIQGIHSDNKVILRVDIDGIQHAHKELSLLCQVSEGP